MTTSTKNSKAKRRKHHVSNDSSFLFSFNSDEIGFEFFLQQSPLADLRFVLGCELRCKLEIEKCWHLSANLLRKNTEGFLPSEFPIFDSSLFLWMLWTECTGAVAEKIRHNAYKDIKNLWSLWSIDFFAAKLFFPCESQCKLRAISHAQKTLTHQILWIHLFLDNWL